MLANIIQFPFRLIWNLLVISVAIGLEIAWIGFLFGSVLGVVLLLIFMPSGFFIPLYALYLLVPIWRDRSFDGDNKNIRHKVDGAIDTIRNGVSEDAPILIIIVGAIFVYGLAYYFGS